MRPHTRMLAVLGICAVALFYGAPASAQCSLEEPSLAECLASKAFDEAVVVVRETRYRVYLPNLRVHDVDVSAFGVVAVEVENEGAGPSPAFEAIVGADATVRGGMKSDIFEVTLQFPPLSSGQRVELVADQLYIPNDGQDWDVSVAVLVDMMDRRSPGGQVWESNEEDNIHNSRCRIYGMEPDYDGTPAC